MARNEEKGYGRLNRLILQKQKDEFAKKNPKRPRLHTLHTVEDIQPWLPGIKSELNVCLKQTECTSYSERKIDELREKVEHLEKTYKSFVRKIRILNPNIKDTPWTPKPYEKDDGNIDVSIEQESTSDSGPKGFQRISMSLLQHCEVQNPVPVLWNVNPDAQDQPLELSARIQSKEEMEKNQQLRIQEQLKIVEQKSSENINKIKKSFGLSNNSKVSSEVDYGHVKQKINHIFHNTPEQINFKNKTDILGLQYSSSDDEQQ